MRKGRKGSDELRAALEGIAALPVARTTPAPAPSQSELVKAAEEVVKEFSPLLWGADGPAQTAIRNLCAALDKVKA